MVSSTLIRTSSSTSLASAPIFRRIEAFVQIENLFDRRYVGTNDGFSPPLLGTPFTAVAGLRSNIQ